MPIGQSLLIRKAIKKDGPNAPYYHSFVWKHIFIGLIAGVVVAALIYFFAGSLNQEVVGAIALMTAAFITVIFWIVGEIRFKKIENKEEISLEENTLYRINSWGYSVRNGVTIGLIIWAAIFISTLMAYPELLGNKNFIYLSPVIFIAVGALIGYLIGNRKK